MSSTQGLVESLKGHFGWHKSRRTCFVQMLLGLIAVRTVNLQAIAGVIDAATEPSSRYRRLQRFFALFEIDFVQIARWIFPLFFRQTDKFYIVIDRTNWYWGKSKLNVFLLGVVYEGLAIPLFWRVLDKGGNSCFKEQQELLNQFVETFGIQQIAGVLADREFANGELFGWFNQHTIPFYIRIKEGSNVSIKQKKWRKAIALFSDLTPKTARPFAMTVELYGQKVFLAGSRSERGQLMIVATNQSPKNAIAIYLRRWEIENLFQGLKGRGFCFEDTHITYPARIAKLMALLAVGFAWAHKVGEWQALKKPIRMKQFQHYRAPQNTFFRYGLDYMRNIIFHLNDKAEQLIECIQLICLPIQPGANS